MSDLVERARSLAEKAHGELGQRRKYTDEPYINHPAAVAAIIASIEHSDEMLAAAWLHDVVEDTPVTLAEIESQFGSQVARYVGMLTDVSTPQDGSRMRRKYLDLLHSAAADPQAKTIKLADIIDNTKNISHQDQNFAAVYLAEKQRLLGVLADAADQQLFSRAMSTLNEAIALLQENAKEKYQSVKQAYYAFHE
jgi:(p)ppGpp synthase/HD superfamily hydrolase